MENNNGRGVFYGVIGVATLIVAIIGATFAYFSAQTNTNNDAIQADAAIIQLAIATDNTHTNLGTNMIPVEADGVDARSTKTGLSEEQKTAYATAATKYSNLFPKFPTQGEDTDTQTEGFQGREACKDLLGNRICSIYTFTISNTSSASQQIYGFMTVGTNTFTNLNYAVFKGNPTDVGNTLISTNINADGTVKDGFGWDVLGTNPTADGDGNYHVTNGGLVHRKTVMPTTVPVDGDVNDEDSYIPGMTVTLQPSTSVTYTVLLWIEETGEDQTDDDSNVGGTAKTFRGGIFVNTSGGGSGVTATLDLAA